MKKIVLSILVVSSLLISAEVTVDQEQLKIEIAKAKEDAQKASDRVKELEAQLPPNEQIITHTELGFIQTEGNTDTASYYFHFDLKKAWDKHLFTFSADGQYAEDRGKQSKNKFLLEAEYAYSLTDRLSATYLLGYKQDRFSGFGYQAYTGPGLRYLTFKTDTQRLDLEGNILYSEDEVEYPLYFLNPNQSNPTEKDSYASYRAKALYSWQALSNLKFEQELSYRGSFEKADNYFVFSQSTLSSKISDMFSAGIGYTVDYTNSPPTSKEYTDRTFTAKLMMDY